MKDSHIEVLRQFLITQMNHWVLFAVAVAGMGIWNDSQLVLWVWIVCSFLPFLLYFVRLRIEPVFFFLVCHILAGYLLWMLPVEGSQQFFLRLMIVCYLLRSVHLRIRSSSQREAAMLPGFAVGLIVVLLVIVHHQQSSSWDQYFVFITIAYLGLYFIQSFLQHYLHFLTVNESSAGHIPAKEMLRSGMKNAFLFTGAGVLFLLLISGLASLSRGWGQLRGFLLWLLRRLFSLLHLEAGEDEPVMEPPESDMELPEPVWDAASPSMFWVILQRIVMTVMLLVLLCAVAVGIGLVIYYIATRLRGRAKTQETELEEVTDVREKCDKEEIFKVRRRVFLFLSPRERIRRIFQKRVLAGKDRILGARKGSRLELFTAYECAGRLDQEILGVLYDKARYSQEECTMEDVRQLKEES